MKRQNHTIVIGVSSGIAAYKIVNLVRILQQKRMDIEVIMTANATSMINPKEFSEVLKHKVHTSLFPNSFSYKKVLKQREVEHVKLTDRASLFVIAPATANIIGKIAAGIADDFVTTSLLATTAPVLICPSMNIHMWDNLVVQENIQKLKQRGYHILTPDSGRLACGYSGIGRLIDVNIIAGEIMHLLSHTNRLKGKKIIVTAGGTNEEIDKVRVITNKASGKMGKALSEECYLRGADVLLLRSVTAVDVREHKDTSGVAGLPDRQAGIQGFPRPACRQGRGGGIRVETFETGQDLSNLMHKYIRDYDAVFHTAAVSDFRVEKPIDYKLESDSPITLKLTPTIKILNQIKIWNPKIKLIGFKAVYKETEKNLVRLGLEKLKESNSDYIIVNDVGRKGIGFAVDTNEVYIVSPKGLLAKIAKAPKTEVAKKILDYIFQN